MNEALRSCGLVVDHPLVQRPADALRDAAMDTALDDHRVDHRPAVVDDAVAQDADLGRHRVGLDDRGVHAVREGRLGGGVEVAALEPRLLVLGHGRLVRVERPGELRRSLGGVVEGVAQGVRQHRNGSQRHRRRRRALDLHPPVDDLEVVSGHLEGVRGDPQGLGLDVARGEAIALPLAGHPALEAKVPTA